LNTKTPGTVGTYGVLPEMQKAEEDHQREALFKIQQEENRRQEKRIREEKEMMDAMLYKPQREENARLDALRKEETKRDYEEKMAQHLEAQLRGAEESEDIRKARENMQNIKHKEFLRRQDEELKMQTNQMAESIKGADKGTKNALFMEEQKKQQDLKLIEDKKIADEKFLEKIKNLGEGIVLVGKLVVESYGYLKDKEGKPLATVEDYELDLRNRTDSDGYLNRDKESNIVCAQKFTDLNLRNPRKSHDYRSENDQKTFPPTKPENEGWFKNGKFDAYVHGEWGWDDKTLIGIERLLQLMGNGTYNPTDVFSPRGNSDKLPVLMSEGSEGPKSSDLLLHEFDEHSGYPRNGDRLKDAQILYKQFLYDSYRTVRDELFPKDINAVVDGGKVAKVEDALRRENKRTGEVKVRSESDAY
jgi:hypothetical protein